MRRVNYSYVILAAGFVILFFSGGSRFAFGLMLKPMSEELGWSRSTLSLAVTAFMLVSALALPVVGRLIDRYSLRTIMGGGAVLGALGIGLMGQVKAPWQLFLVYGIVFAIGNAANSNPAVGVMVSRWFARRRGVATSTAVSGSAIGQLVIITVLSSILFSLGWRTAFTVLGVVSLAVVVPVVLAAVRSTPQLSQEDAREPVDSSGASSYQTTETEIAVNNAPIPLGRIMGSHQFMLLVAVYAICGFQDFFIATHVVAFAEDQGVGRVLAGNLLAFMGLMGLIGVLAAGILSDAFDPSRPTALCFSMRIGLFAAILYFQNTVAVGAFALLYGFTFLITAPLTVIFAGSIFGPARLGMVAGSFSMVHQITGGLGALVGALIFDQWGSYDRGFLLLLVLSLIALPLTLMVRGKPLMK